MSYNASLSLHVRKQHEADVLRCSGKILGPPDDPSFGSYDPFNGDPDVARFDWPFENHGGSVYALLSALRERGIPYIALQSDDAENFCWTLEVFDGKDLLCEASTDDGDLLVTFDPMVDRSTGVDVLAVPPELLRFSERFRAVHALICADKFPADA